MTSLPRLPIRVGSTTTGWTIAAGNTTGPALVRERVQ